MGPDPSTSSGQELKTCQNCKTEFTIRPEDFVFYGKIHSPPPTWCPACRMQRRIQFRNLKTVYKRKTLDSDQEVFSVFAPDSPFRVYSQPYWMSDKREPAAGLECDFSVPFLSQIKELMLKSPWAAGYNLSSLNSEYCNNCFGLKNCYLTFNSGHSEDCTYAVDTRDSRSCMDTLKTDQCELGYELFDCQSCYKALFSSHCHECTDIYFCKELSGCHDCFGCVNLKNKSFHIFNQPYSKEEYQEKLKQLWTGSFSSLAQTQKEFLAHQLKFPVRFRHGFHNENVTGDYVDHSKNCHQVYYSTDLVDCSYCHLVLFGASKDSYDMAVAQGGGLCYEMEEAGGYQVQFAWYAGTSKMDQGIVDVRYSMNCFNSDHLFGCVGLKNKSYCILNKEYSKEEYAELVPKIIQHMNELPYVDSMKRIYKYGEFFPPEFSPFAYNETLAQEYFPLTKAEAELRGYRWREPEKRQYPVSLKSSELPDNLNDVSDSITSEIISCAHEGQCNDQCTAAFKIIPQELQFYRTLNLPLPRLCPNCRYSERIKQRSPLKLWHRNCQCSGNKHQITSSKSQISTNIESSKLQTEYQNTAQHAHGDNPCPNEFETSYAPDRPEMVYCESCHQAETV